jgi:hypothetical protein
MNGDRSFSAKLERESAPYDECEWRIRPDNPYDHGRDHGQPTRFIVATAITHEAMLLTADDALSSWRSKLKRHDAEI